VDATLHATAVRFSTGSLVSPVRMDSRVKPESDDFIYFK
jgi:hypothetical protein